MAAISITQVTQRSGLPASTLRYYEEIGLLRSTGRVGGRRQYDDSVLQRLALIQTGQLAGFTLAEIAALIASMEDSQAEGIDWQALVRRKLHEMDAQMRNIQDMKRLLEAIMDCEDEHLAECIGLVGQKHR
jgi:DNA-binding transcriptional MerR regulator